MDFWVASGSAGTQVGMAVGGAVVGSGSRWKWVGVCERVASRVEAGAMGLSSSLFRSGPSADLI